MDEESEFSTVALCPVLTDSFDRPVVIEKTPDRLTKRTTPQWAPCR
jgi:hypothetical protein